MGDPKQLCGGDTNAFGADKRKSVRVFQERFSHIQVSAAFHIKITEKRGKTRKFMAD